MTANLNLYFSQYAENSLKTVRHCNLAKNFYSGVARRLDQGHDFSDELPDVAKLGVKETQKVVDAAIDEYALNEKNAWELPSLLANQAKSKVSMSKDTYETYPRYLVAHVFKTPAGLVKVFIATKGENYTVDIDSGRNKMAAEAAKLELEKIISFTSLLNT